MAIFHSYVKLLEGKRINHQDAWQWLFENAWQVSRANPVSITTAKSGNRRHELSSGVFVPQNLVRNHGKTLGRINIEIPWGVCLKKMNEHLFMAIPLDLWMLNNVEMEVSWVMRVPLNHHLFEWDFPWNTSSSYWDVPLWLWTPPNLGSHKNRQHSADLDANAQRVRLSDAARRTVPLKNPLLGVQFQSLQVVI